ncbi:MAG: glycogen synthase [Calditrichaeota bacterium]|nr:MAG: glycogen synthase [Calditrichota bacterium]
MNQDQLKICFVSSEVVPFSKTGGLADVAGALCKFLGRQGVDVRLFTPFYDTIDTRKFTFYPVTFLQQIPLEMGSRQFLFNVLTAQLPGSEVDVYFVDCPALYHRGRLYTEDPDEYLRFAFLSRAAIECCQRMGWGPHIFHCNDWQTALIPLYLKTLYSWDGLFRHSKTVLTIHNIGYQGQFSSSILHELGLGAHRNLFWQDDLAVGMVNFLKTGILYADMLTTVSETYAREIQTEAYGAGLHPFLQMRANSLVGIVNGVDYEEWNPETDPYIPYHYSIRDLAGKEKDKAYLLNQLGLTFEPHVPLYGIVSRLTAQKGFDLLFDCLFDILAHNAIRFVVLGSGESRYEEFFQSAQQAFPDKFCFYRGYSNELAHLIEAGADMFVMPSRYEPCGLNQIYSLKYGTIPIVRKTGGLADTVQNYDWVSQTGTGFVFEHFTSDGLRWAMGSAYETYQHRDAWLKLMRNAMSQNFSWEVQGQKYIALYWRVAGRSG